MTTQKSFYLIDGSAYIFRAFYAIRQNLSNAKGLPTNALYGFTNMLLKVIRDEQPDYLAMVFDTKEKTFRHDMYALYKANRQEPPEELKQQFPYFEPIVDALNIPCLKQEGFEADDIIGTLARRGEEKGLKVVIVSGDKDMMQLITPNIQMLDTMKNKWIGEPEVLEKFGVPPNQVIEVMGLMGDSSDNIPGVGGVGPKTATELIQTYGSIKDLYENLQEIKKKKLVEKLTNDRDNAFLSHKLVTIETGMDLPFKLDDFKIREKNTEKTVKLFTELNFTSLIPEGENDQGATPSPKAQKDYRSILIKEDLETLIKDLKKAGEFALDLETTSKHPVRAEMVGISFAWKDHSAVYIPVSHRYLGVPDQLEKSWVLKKLKPILEDPSFKKFGHNIKYDLIVLKNESIDMVGIAFDSMIASYILDPSKRNHGMDDAALEILNHQTIHYKDVVGTASKEIGFDQVEIEKATEYAAEDSDITLLLTKALEQRLKGETLELFNNMEMPLIEVLADIELKGVLIDNNHLSKLSEMMAKDLRNFEREIHELAGEEFNINSPKQLAVILFEKLKLPVIKKTKTGPSTDMSVLEELSQHHELPEKIVSYRQRGKLKSTYVDALPKETVPKTGRVHTSFNQTIAATGRLSSSDPNLQNIPIKSDLGKEIRKAFIAPKGYQLLSADYSQIELRILAHLSSDEFLIKAFKKGEDIHTRTAAEIFGVALKEVSESDRRMAKAVNFGIVYGLSAFGLSRQLKISPKEAKTFIEQYFDLYKGVKQFMDDTIKSAAELGYTKTLMNRIRYLPDINSRNKQVRAATERIAINSPVQGSAADLIKLAMIRIHQQLHELKLESRMILQVHDELLFECPKSEQKQMETLVKKEMEGVFKLKVPLVIDMGWGNNWNEAH